VVEHLRGRRGRQLSRLSQLSRRQLTALIQLDQELELGVGDIAASEMRVASTHAIQRTKDTTEGNTELSDRKLTLVG
jgi:hypothetical protein